MSRGRDEAGGTHVSRMRWLGIWRKGEAEIRVVFLPDAGTDDVRSNGLGVVSFLTATDPPAREMSPLSCLLMLDGRSTFWRDIAAKPSKLKQGKGGGDCRWAVKFNTNVGMRAVAHN